MEVAARISARQGWGESSLSTPSPIPLSSRPPESHPLPQTPAQGEPEGKGQSPPGGGRTMHRRSPPSTLTNPDLTKG
eukprot:148756-Rhodomonas_salina.1